MKTEINNDNKAKFLSLYWGQKILMSRIGNSHLWGEIIDELSEGGIVCPIELKPLSSILDEDAIEIGNILEMDYKECFMINEVKDWLDSKMGFGRIKHKFECFQILDYLRSKGYALPWMGLSVEEMVESGWIKLIVS